MQLFIGPLVHTLNPTTIQYSQLSIVGLSNSGSIDFIQHDINNLDSALESILDNESNKAKGWSKGVKTTILKHGEFMCPGFIDTHTHGELFLYLITTIRLTSSGSASISEYRKRPAIRITRLAGKCYISCRRTSFRYQIRQDSIQRSC